MRREATGIWSQEALGLAISYAGPQLYQAVGTLRPTKGIGQHDSEENEQK